MVRSSPRSHTRTSMSSKLGGGSRASDEDGRTISKLEERLAEADQDAELMQREIDRLEQVIERQRSLGKLDSLLFELDHIQQQETKGPDAEPDHRNGAGHRRPGTRSQSSASKQTQFDEAIPEVEEDAASEAGSAAKAAETRDATPKPKTLLVKHADTDVEFFASPVQSHFVVEKLETVTQELIDLRVEHESTLGDFHMLNAKYQEALRAIVEMQDVIDEVKQPGRSRDSMLSVWSPLRTRPGSFLSDARWSQNHDGTRFSSSRSLSSELSSVLGSPAANLESSDAETAVPKTDSHEAHRKNVDGKDVYTEMAPLKVMAADKEAVEKEQAIKYAELQEKHQEALDMVEELKTEIAKAQAANTEASSPRSNTPIIRRKSGHNFMIIDRAHRSFASLRKIAAENFEGQPDVLQNFDLNLNSAMHELHARSQRIQELEADVATAKREMEAKMTIISGLTRERASLKASSMDMATISNLREQLEEKETQVKQMREDHAAREKELESQIEALLESVEQKSTKDERSQHAMEPEAAPSQQQEMHGERVANLEAELAAWEGKHREALEDMQSTEQQMRNTVLELESQVASYQEQLKAAQGGQAKTDEEMSEGAEAETKHNELVGFLRTEIDEYKAIINKNAARVAEAEEQHAAAKALLDTAARDRDAAAGEASAHKELAAKLEAQLAEHEQAIKAHHENMENLRSQHAKNIDDIQSSWRQDRDSKLTAVQAEHAEDIKACESALTEAREELMKVATQVAFALGLDVSVDKITQRIGDLIENQKALGQEQQKRSELEQHVAELTKVNDAVMRDLEAVKSGLTDILLTNGEMLQSPFLSVTEQLAMVQKKLADLETRNKTNSGLVEQLEDQLQNTFDLTQAANNRFSTLQSERNAALEEAIMAKTKLQAELETVREEHATLRVSSQIIGIVLTLPSIWL